jgi:hypothetical protein
MASGNKTVKVPDEFVSFDEAGLTVRVGPNLPDNDYDCELDVIPSLLTYYGCNVIPKRGQSFFNYVESTPNTREFITQTKILERCNCINHK